VSAVHPHTFRRILGFAVLFGLAAALRLYRLAELPPGNWYDEAIYGLDALRVLREPGWPLFFTTEGHPREPMFLYLAAWVYSLAGPGTTALRVTSVLIGLATLAAVWLWAREVGGERRAWIVAWILALLPWHIHFSRLGFRVILTPLFVTLVMWAAWRAGRSRQFRWAAVCGLFLGLGLTTYLAFRVVPLLLLLVALHAAWRARRFAGSSETAAAPPEPPPTPSAPPTLSPSCPRPRYRWALGIVLGLAIGGAPTYIDAIQHPEHLTGRAGEVNPFAGGVGSGLRLIGKQTLDVGLMFFIRGDHVAKHNIPGAPRWAQLYWWRSPGAAEAEQWAEIDRARRMMGQPPLDPHGRGLPVFDPLTAVFFAVGLVLLLRRAHRDTVAFSILAWMVLIALTSIFSFGAPNYLRMLGMTPAVAFVLAEGVEYARERLRARWGACAATIFLAVFFVHFAVLGAKRYFVDWPRHPITWTEFNTEFAELARWIRRQPADHAFQAPDFLRLHPTFVFETVDRRGILDFNGVEARQWAAHGGRVWVIAPRPPYPAAPVAESWYRSRTPARVLERPDGFPWVAVYAGPAPPAVP
jgi:hypothetical protein